MQQSVSSFRLRFFRFRYSNVSSKPTTLGFTLVELLTSITVLSLIMFLVFSMISESSRILRKTRGKTDSFGEARSAFTQITNTLKQATLNPYLDYYDAAGNRRDPSNSGSFTPNSYGRYSELHFVCDNAASLIGTNAASGSAAFFQAPLGKTNDRTRYGQLNSLLNAVGYYVTYSSEDNSQFPTFLPASSLDEHRFRLMEYVQEPETLPLFDPSQYSSASAGWPDTNFSWFDATNTVNLSSRSSQIGADIALILFVARYRDSAGNEQLSYSYNSRSGTLNTITRHQLPAYIDLYLVALDKTSGTRLFNEFGTATPPIINPSLFSNPSILENDLDTLEQNLTARRLSYHIFTGSVRMEGASWSIQ